MIIQGKTGKVLDAFEFEECISIPEFSEIGGKGGKMNKNQIIVTVVLLIIGTILIAGCTFPAGSENHTNNVSVNVTTFTAAATSLQTQCPQSGNPTPWIIINPIGNHYIGDVFEINGTTNLGINEPLLYWVSHKPYLDRNALQPDVINGFVITHNLDCNTTLWSFLINTTEFSPGYYDVTVGTENMTIAKWDLFVLVKRIPKSGVM